MSDITPPRNEIWSENSDMSFTVEGSRREMQQHVRAVAGLASDDGIKSALNFAAGILRLPYQRVRALYYGEARRIDAHEADQIRAYVKQAETLIEARHQYENRRQEFLANAPRFMARLAPPALPKVAATDAHRGGR